MLWVSKQWSPCKDIDDCPGERVAWKSLYLRAATDSLAPGMCYRPRFRLQNQFAKIIPLPPPGDFWGREGDWGLFIHYELEIASRAEQSGKYPLCAGAGENETLDARMSLHFRKRGRGSKGMTLNWQQKSSQREKREGVSNLFFFGILLFAVDG